MKCHLISIACCTVVLALWSCASRTVSQPEAAPVPAPLRLEDVLSRDPYQDGPPCGIPCQRTFDEAGKFVDCVSPCCNCRELNLNSEINPRLVPMEPESDSSHSLR